MDYKTDDLRIKEIDELVAPVDLLREFAMTRSAAATVWQTRQEVHKILHGADDRLLVIMGPCSIPDVNAPGFNETAIPPYIGASYQRVAETLAAMCADKTINATFVVEHVPDALVSPTDLALSSRQEGRTPAQATPPATQPALAPSTLPATPDRSLPPIPTIPQ